MKPDFEMNRSALAAERLKLWSNALDLLAQEDIASQIIAALENGDLRRFEALLEPTGLFQTGICIDIVDSITKLINFGPGHFEPRCDVVPVVHPFPTSEQNGRLYTLDDGTIIFVSERLWFDYHQRAIDDTAWREANKALLLTLGILRCHTVLVRDSKLVTLDRSRTLCFSTTVLPEALPDQGEEINGLALE
jgi:hypothetical protein